MYNKRILQRFQNPENAGGIRGSNGTGKAEDGKEVVKIYIAVNEDGVIKNANFKAYGGVCTIVACDIACMLIEDGTLEEALKVSAQDIMDEVSIPEEKLSSASLAEEAIKSAVEDYYKKREKELKTK